MHFIIIEEKKSICIVVIKISTVVIIHKYYIGHNYLEVGKGYKGLG